MSPACGQPLCPDGRATQLCTVCRRYLVLVHAMFKSLGCCFAHTMRLLLFHTWYCSDTYHVVHPEWLTKIAFCVEVDGRTAADERQPAVLPHTVPDDDRADKCCYDHARCITELLRIYRDCKETITPCCECFRPVCFFLRLSVVVLLHGKLYILDEMVHVAFERVERVLGSCHAALRLPSYVCFCGRVHHCSCLCMLSRCRNCLPQVERSL